MAFISPKTSSDPYEATNSSSYSEQFEKNSSSILNLKHEIMKITEQPGYAPLSAELFDVIDRVSEERGRFEGNSNNYLVNRTLSKEQHGLCQEIRNRFFSELKGVYSLVNEVFECCTPEKCLNELNECINELGRISKSDLTQKDRDDFKQVMTRIKGIRDVLSDKELTVLNKFELNNKLTQFRAARKNYECRNDNVKINNKINDSIENSPELKLIEDLNIVLSKVSSESPPKDLAEFFTEIEPKITAAVTGSMGTSTRALALYDVSVKVLRQLYELENANISSIHDKIKQSNPKEYTQIMKEFKESRERFDKICIEEARLDLNHSAAQVQT